MYKMNMKVKMERCRGVERIGAREEDGVVETGI